MSTIDILKVTGQQRGVACRHRVGCISAPKVASVVHLLSGFWIPPPDLSNWHWHRLEEPLILVVLLFRAVPTARGHSWGTEQRLTDKLSFLLSFHHNLARIKVSYRFGTCDLFLTASLLLFWNFKQFFLNSKVGVQTVVRQRAGVQRGQGHAVLHSLQHPIV